MWAALDYRVIIGMREDEVGIWTRARGAPALQSCSSHNTTYTFPNPM